MKEEITAIVKEARQELSAYKSGCVDMFYTEFTEMNWSEFSKKRFGKSSSWLMKKFKGCIMPKKEKPFTPEEYDKLVSVLREMSDELSTYADMIEKAKIIEPE